MNGIDGYLGTRDQGGAATGTWKFERRVGVGLGSRAELAYRNGTRHGAFRASHFAQELANGRFENGLPAGPWEFHYPNGQLMAKGRMEKGVRCGPWVHYASDGSELPAGETAACDDGTPGQTGTTTNDAAKVIDPFANRPAPASPTPPTHDQRPPINDGVVDPFAKKKP